MLVRQFDDVSLPKSLQKTMYKNRFGYTYVLDIIDNGDSIISMSIWRKFFIQIMQLQAS